MDRRTRARIIRQRKIKRRIRISVFFILLFVVAGIFIYQNSVKVKKAYNKAVALYKDENYDSSLNRCNFVIKNANTNNRSEFEYYLSAIYLKAEIYIKQKNKESAIESYRQAVEEDTKIRDFGRLITATNYLRRGLAYMKLEEYGNAVDSFNNGLELANIKCEQELMYNKAIAYEYDGNWEKAKETMQEYIDKYPNDEKANEEWEFIKSR